MASAGLESEKTNGAFDILRVNNRDLLTEQLLNLNRSI